MARPTLVFLLGTGRCGSTLLSDLLCEHASVGFVSSLDDGYRLPLGLQARATTFYQRAPKAWSRVARRFWVAPSEGYHALAREVSFGVVAPARDLVDTDAAPWIAERMRHFYERRMKAQARPVFVHKYTGWPRARFLHRIFPDARFVHVIRDGRAVANSLLQQRWWTGFSGPDGWGWGPLPDAYQQEWLRSGRSFPVLAGIEWMILMDAFRDASRDIPRSQWLELHYEDLLLDPHASIRRVLEFLGLRVSEQFASRFDLYEFRTSRAEAFRRDLAPRDVAILEEVLAGHLSEFGYLPHPAT